MCIEGLVLNGKLEVNWLNKLCSLQAVEYYAVSSVDMQRCMSLLVFLFLKYCILNLDQRDSGIIVTLKAKTTSFSSHAASLHGNCMGVAFYLISSGLCTSVCSQHGAGSAPCLFLCGFHCPVHSSHSDSKEEDPGTSYGTGRRCWAAWPLGTKHRDPVEDVLCTLSWKWAANLAAFYRSSL